MIRFKFVPAFITFMAVAAVQPLLRAQQTAPVSTGTIIKSESNLVVVDASVAGKKDKPALDLKQSDFQVFQDGVELPISSFSAPAENAEGSDEYLLFFFDAATTSLNDQQRARKAAMDFIKKAKQSKIYMGAEDYSGVVHLVQNFTTDREQMAKAISELKFGHPSAGVGDTETERFLVTLTEVSRALGELRGRKALVLLSGGYPIPEIFRDQLSSTIAAANRANVTIYPVDTHSLNDATKGANDVEGYRGLNVSSPTNMRDPSSGLRNVSVVPTSRNGTPEIGGSTPKNVVGEELLDRLANDTGGFMVLNTNDFYDGFTKINDDITAHYTLGFVPPENPATSGYHRIEVRVKDAGLKVRTRNGYFESKGLDLLAGKPSGKALLDNLNSSEAGTIPLSMSAPFFYLDAKKARVNLALEFPGKSLHFEEANGQTRYQFDVLGIAFRPDGTVARRFSDSVNQVVDKENKDKLAGQPFNYQSTFEIEPGQYKLVVVTGAGGSDFGKSAAVLDITPYDEHSISLSGVVLSDQLQPVSPLLASVTGQIGAQSDSLVAGGYQIQPSATRMFSDKKTAVIYVQVYEPALLAPNPPKVGVICEINDSKSHAMVYKSDMTVINSLAVAGSPVIQVAMKIPMEKLTPGSYLMEVQAADSTGHNSTVRLTDFSIE